MDLKPFWTRFLRVFRYYAYIFDEIDTEDAAQRIKSSIWFRGPNAWILAFAIVLASVLHGRHHRRHAGIPAYGAHHRRRSGLGNQ